MSTIIITGNLGDAAGRDCSFAIYSGRNGGRSCIRKAVPSTLFSIPVGFAVAGGADSYIMPVVYLLALGMAFIGMGLAG